VAEQSSVYRFRATSRRIRRLTAARRWPLTVAVLPILVALCSFSQAQAQESGPTETEQAAPQSAQDAESASEAEQKQQRSLVTAAFGLLMGIALIGVLMLMFVVVLGKRTRRIARKAAPPQSEVDELWYLRAEKKVEGSARATDSDDLESGDSRPSDA